MKQGPLIASLILAVAVIGATVILTKPESSTVNNVRQEGSTQIIEIDAKGGYAPKITTAKAGVTTILRVNTSGTYDCSAALSIPKLGFQKNLDATGTTEISIPAQEPGSVIQGVCAMGMYNFQLRFEG